MTQVTDIPTDIIIFEMMRFMTLCQIVKLAMTNRQYRNAVNKITQSNKIDCVLFGTVDTRIAHRMTYQGLTYNDLAHSSFIPSFIDEMISLLHTPEICSLYKVRQMFKFTKRARRCIRYSRYGTYWVAIEDIKMHNRIFKINEYSDVTKDFKIFQFLLYLIDDYTQDLTQYVLYASLIEQLMQYFQDMSYKSLSGICKKKEDQDILNQRIIEKQKQIYNDVSHYFHTLSIADININLYNYYSIIMASFVSDMLPLLISHDQALKFKQVGIDEQMIVKPLYQLKQTEQSCTLAALIDMVEYESSIDARSYMIGMLFSYTNTIIKDGLMDINDTKNTRFISEYKNKGKELMDDIIKIADHSCFNQHYAIASGILKETQEILT